MSTVSHEWLCPNCGGWTPDVSPETSRGFALLTTRCARPSCKAPRPDIVEYRKREAMGRVSKVEPSGPPLRQYAQRTIVWECGNCGSNVDTSHNSCPDCYATRPVNARFRIEEPAKDTSPPTFGALIGLIGVGLLWYAAGWEVSLGVFLTLWGDNLTRNWRPSK